MQVLKRFFDIRFELFFFSLLSIIFGSLFVPTEIYNTNLLPSLLLLNIVIGLIVVSENKTLIRLFLLLLLGFLSLYVLHIVGLNFKHERLFRNILLFIYFAFITVNLIKQVWLPRCVSTNLIFGLMCGYISLGMLGFFMSSGIEAFQSNSYMYQLMPETNIMENSSTMLYYSFITLLTIGYGDIIPVTEAAQKATMLIGLAGQFYLVIITGVVVGKYINGNHI